MPNTEQFDIKPILERLLLKGSIVVEERRALQLGPLQDLQGDDA